MVPSMWEIKEQQRLKIHFTFYYSTLKLQVLIRSSVSLSYN